MITLYNSGFAHRYLRCPSRVEGCTFENCLIKSKGLRLDVGIFNLRVEFTTPFFDKFVELERMIMSALKEYFLNW